MLDVTRYYIYGSEGSHTFAFEALGISEYSHWAILVTFAPHTSLGELDVCIIGGFSIFSGSIHLHKIVSSETAPAQISLDEQGLTIIPYDANGGAVSLIKLVS